MSDEVDELLDGSFVDKEQLKNLLIQQVKLLDCGLYIHGCHLNEASKLLHDSLIDGFDDYRQKVEKLCGTKCSVSLARKSSVEQQPNESTSHRKHYKYLSRLSTDSTSLSASDLKPAIQQRSMSISTRPTTPKRKLTNTDAPPLPTRRSNRHSSKLLFPET